jgi:hypothetical protein
MTNRTKLLKGCRTVFNESVNNLASSIHEMFDLENVILG